MKLLVFDNYNKFITAETTIRQMREKVDTMEDEMTKLSSKIERISENSEEINESLQSKKKQIDVLVGVHKLLQKVNLYNMFFVFIIMINSLILSSNFWLIFQEN